MDIIEIEKRVRERLANIHPNTIFNQSTDPYIYVTHVTKGGAESCSFSFFYFISPGDTIHNDHAPLALLKSTLILTVDAINTIPTQTTHSSKTWAYTVVRPTASEMIIIVVIANKTDAEWISTQLANILK